MTFPVIAGTSSGVDNTADTSLSITLPGGYSVDDLLIIFAEFDRATSSFTVTTPTGWTELESDDYGSYYRVRVWYRVATGSEGASVTVTISDNARAGYVVYDITGYDSVPESNSAVGMGGGSTTPDPPSLSPSWGSDDTLFIAFAACQDEDFTAYPSNYSLSQLTEHGTNASVAVAARDLAASSDNPGTFTIASKSPWLAYTIAVKPGTSGGGGGGGGGTATYRMMF